MTDLPASQDETPDQSKADALFRRAAIRYVPLLMACYVVAYLDRVNIGYAREQLAHDIGLGDFAYGLGAGLFFVGYVIFEVPSNAILYRVGARTWIARIMISWSLVSAAFALVQDPYTFYFLRFLLGAAEAGFFPGVLLFLSCWFPTRYKAKIIAIFMAAIPLAGLVGGPLSGFLLSYTDGLGGMHGWQWMFLAEAAPATILAFVVLKALDSTLDEAKWLDPAEKALIAKELEDANIGKSPDIGFKALVTRSFFLFSAIYFVCVMAQYGITFWLPTLIASAGATTDFSIGLYSALPYLFAILCMILVGYSSDKLNERRWHLTLSMVIGAIALALVPFAGSNFVLAMVMMCLATGAIIAATPLFSTLPTQHLKGRSAAVGIAGINSIGNLAGFASPFAVGWIAQSSGSTTGGMLLLAICLILGAFMVLARKETKPGR